MVGWRQDENAGELLAKVGAEMAKVAGDELSAASLGVRHPPDEGHCRESYQRRGRRRERVRRQ